MTICFQMRNIFDISQNSFACAKKINFDGFFPSKHYLSAFVLYIYTELIHQWLGVAHYDRRGPHNTTPLEK